MKTYLEFILERQHISLECIDFRNQIMREVNIKNIWNKLQNSKSHINSKLFDFNFSFKKDKFKVENLYIEVNLHKYKENICNATLKDIKGLRLEDDITHGSKIDVDIYIKELTDDFIMYINSVMLHEIVHLYEQYNLLKGKKFRPKSWSIGSMLPKLRKDYKNKDIQTILDLLYKSLKHEISSQLHQYFDYKSNYKEYKKIFDIQNSLKNFNIDNITIDDIFIKELNEIRFHLYKSIEYSTTNKNYLKDLNKSIWKNEIDKNNVEQFLIDLKEMFSESDKYIDLKIQAIDRKHEEPDYSGGILTEQFKLTF